MGLFGKTVPKTAGKESQDKNNNRVNKGHPLKDKLQFSF